MATRAPSLPDGRLASASKGETIKLWKKKEGTEEMECDATLIGLESEVHTLVALKDGALASASKSKMIQLWDTKRTHKCVRTLKHHSGVIIGLAVQEDGTLISAADGDLKAVTTLGRGSLTPRNVIVDGATRHTNDEIRPVKDDKEYAAHLLWMEKQMDEMNQARDSWEADHGKGSFDWD